MEYSKTYVTKKEHIDLQEIMDTDGMITSYQINITHGREKINKLMRIVIILAMILTSFNLLSYGQTDSLVIRRIYDEALINGKSYQNLHFLCKSIGPRLSGSSNAQKAVEWGKSLMESYDFDRVYLQEVKVPHWVRGEKEKGIIIEGKTKTSVNLAALGGSVSTPVSGITAEVIELHDLKDLEILGEKKIKGKIVFFNRPIDDRNIEVVSAYGKAVDQRSLGPGAASKYGAVAVIIRSLTSAIDDHPHAGQTNYGSNSPIPAAALSTIAANRLSESIKRAAGKPVLFYLKDDCKILTDTISYNVIGELKGVEKPNEFITVGGHLDSWDLGEGAHDDGTGIVQSVEALRIFKTMGYRPKHTIRAVFFMNEENGDRGAVEYAELAVKNKENHIAAIESDEGGFTPRGFRFSNLSNQRLEQINESWKSLFSPYHADELTRGGNAVDIGYLKKVLPGIVLIDFKPDGQRYFDIHHSSNDIFENVNKRELELGAASIASLIYLIDQHNIR